MSKIIIHIEDEDLPNAVAMKAVYKAITQGFLSGEKQYYWHTILLYCYLSVFEIDVIAMKVRGSTHTFKVRMRN